MPPARRLLVQSLLVGDECVVAWFAPDLDDALRYASSLVVLTDRRLVSVANHGAPRSPRDTSSGLAADTSDSQGVPTVSAWPLGEIVALKTRDRAGVGVLEAIGPAGRLAHWRYTVGEAPGANRLVDHLEHYRRGERLEDEGLGDPEESDAEAVDGSAMGSLWRLTSFAARRGRLVLLGFVLTLLATGVGLIPPYLTMPLVDDVLIPYQNKAERLVAEAQARDESPPVVAAALRGEANAEFRRVLWYLAALGGAALVAWGASWAQGVVMAWVSERIGADLRISTYAHLQSLSLEFFGKKRTGDLISRISADTERICNYLSDNLVDFGADVLMMLGTAIVLFAIDPWLALVTLVPFPIIAWLIYLVRGQLQHGFSRGGRAWGAMTSLLADTIPGIRVVKAFAQERREIERFRRANDQVLEANDRVNTVWTFFWPMVVLLNQAGLLVVWAFGAWRVFELRITVGVLTAFLAYIGRFYTRLESMSRMMTATQRAAASARRVFDILDREPSVAEPRRPVACDGLRGEVEFAGVSFRYGSRPILEAIDLKIRPGEMIGLVGPSGAGKSTLVNLACRFYDVTEGAVLIDGVDLRSFPIADYRRHVGIVLQEPFLFFGSIAENIAYGWPEATRQQIVAAARAARRARFHSSLAAGLRFARRRARAVAFGRRTATDLDRAGPADRSADSDSRRSHVERRHGNGARYSSRARQPGARPHDDRHRPSPEHAPQGRSARGARAGTDRRDRTASRAPRRGRRVCSTARCPARNHGAGRRIISPRT